MACNQSLEIQKTMVWQPCWMTEPFVLSSNVAAMPLSFWISRDWLQTIYRELMKIAMPWKQNGRLDKLRKRTRELMKSQGNRAIIGATFPLV